MTDIDIRAIYGKDFTMNKEEKRMLQELHDEQTGAKAVEQYKKEQRRKFRETVYLAVAVLSCAVTIYCNFLR